MNLHLPQNEAAEAELRHLAAIPYQIISPASNSPIIGIFQDSLLGAYRITRDKLYFTRREAMNMLMMFPRVDVDKLLKYGDKIPSMELISQIMPSLSMKQKTKMFEDDENFQTSNNVLEIRNGEYIRGQMEKGVLGSGTKGILHRVCNDFGNMACSDFIDDLQNIVTEYMKTSSYSVGISDLIADINTQKKIIDVITQQKKEVQILIDRVQLGIFENNTANSNNVEFEKQVNAILNKASEESGKIGRKNLDKNNRFVTIVKCGSKGSDLNISQMISCLGQQNVDGKRISYGFDSRTLPHFTKFDDSPGARGFVENSYIQGLTPPQLFFHAMGGRIGLIDTACKSVVWNTPIVIIENNKPIYTEIGRWIDAKLAKASIDDIEKHVDRNMELLNLMDDVVYIPTTDEKGIVSWGELTAVTRHDPGERLYEVKTHGGRTVTVAESNSLLIWNSTTTEFREMNSSNVKIGDFVPVSVELPTPPVQINFINMENYLPKNEYVYGTEFNKAHNMMIESMENRKKIPSGWWNTNNGSTFTLPYSKKSSLQRTTNCSNINNIKDGYIYPYHAQRIETFIPDKFELNEDNGIFIGLFLAEGNASKNNVTITNNDENIRSFVKNWFNTHSIHYEERQRINKIGGLTTTIRGNSSILATFITKLVGSGSQNKFVPNEAFISNEKFMIGLLNGYYSGDGHIAKNSIDVCSASSRLIEGISMLCSRFGIFGRISKTQLKRNNFNTQNIKPSYRFNISALWAKIFIDKIVLLENKKQTKMNSIKWRSKHMNFTQQNNVVLDKIIEINIIGTENHPKLYDVTVPSTLNFGLANGLQVRDTSSTGYIQRRLIKAMEDLKIEYDMTVRNSKGKIIQFSYGGDGADTIKVENQHIPLTGMSLEDIYLHYDMMLEDKTSKLAYTKQTATRITKQMNETRKKCLEYIEQAIEDRDELMKRVFKYKNENEVKCPVAFHYIISNIQGQMHLGTNSLVDITPLEAFKLIEENLEKLKKLKYAQPTDMFIILYNFYLNPKDLLIIKRFNKKALIVLLEHVNLAYKQALVNPGEMVGVIAGQSIGEPTTQMTLNSVTYETEIIVRDSTQQIHKLKIGDFVKNHIDKSQKKIYYDEKDTTYAELSSNEEYFEIPGSNEEGETVWNRIEAVTQHPVINKDGTNTMLKLTTKGQKEVIVTKAKSVLKLIDGKIQKADGETLKIDDYLVISRKPLEYKENNILNLYDILSPTKYIYGSEMDKARKLIHETHWWKKYSGKSFIIPYSRSDSARYVLDKTIDNSRVSNKEYLTGFVYTKNSGCSGTNKNDGSLPDIIDMDYDFGYLVGAYAAEGCMTKHQISISNNDIEYFKPIYRFCKKLNITTKLYSKQCGENDKWKSTDIRLYNTLLCNILENICGKLSHNKFLSPKIVFSNKECISGFLDAYIGGDGYITNRLNEINATSVSLQLLLDIQVMTRNIDIVGKIHKSKKSISNNIGTLPENIHQPYKLSFTQNQCYKMANMLNLLITNKQERILKLRVKKFRYNISKHDDKIFPNEINGIINYEERKGKMEDLLFEKIVKIEEVNNTTNYAYDLTVENTRNFDTYTGINLDDTFHFSGISSKSNVTRGVPRIEEILRLTKNPKNPSLTVFMKPTEEQSKEKSIHYTHMLEHTKIADLVKTVQICFDPNPRTTIIKDDKIWLEQFYAFEEVIKDCEGRNSEENTKSSKWIIRLELDPETMLDKNITMDDIHYALTNYSNDIECAFTDYNADNLVFRIRLNNNLITKNKKKASTFTLDQTDELYLLNAFQDDLLNKIVLRGIPGITKVMPRKLQGYTVYEDGKYVVKDKWVLDTTGSNLMHVLSLDYIDVSRTYSNDIREIQNVLGIEATRQMIYNELLEVIEFSGAYVNSHHLHLLADRMTITKNLVPVFRSGILNDDVGPIAKATFEVHTEEFLSAARHGVFDHMRGISANVMTGQNGYYGTSAFQLVLDMKEIQQNVKPPVINKKDTTDQDISLDGLIRDFNKIEIDKCSTEQIRITNNIQHIKQIDLGDIECSNNDEFIGF